MLEPLINDESIRVSKDRYFTEDEKEILVKDAKKAFSLMYRRISRAIALAERDENKKDWEEEFFIQLYSQKLIPAGRICSNAGFFNQQFPNCFVYPIYDSKESIFETLKIAGICQSSGGGTGFDFSRLRSRGMSTTKSRGTASGPCSFLKLYDAMGDTIVQGGSRRSASMGILRVDHPDILEFIFLKDKSQKIRRFNISVAITDIFMLQLKEHKMERHIVTDPSINSNYYIFIPTGDKIVEGIENQISFLKEILATNSLEEEANYLKRELVDGSVQDRKGFFITVELIWEAIIQQAWYCADPGLFFVDSSNKKNIMIEDIYDTNNEYYIRATNPCGEENMEDNNICMLSSINLEKFVDDAGQIDVDSLQKTVGVGIRFLDNALDVSTYPTEDNKMMAYNLRRIGLGVLGWADVLIKMKLIYGSVESINIAEKIMKIINDAALKASMDIGKEKGSFPLFEKSNYKEGKNGCPKLYYLRNAYRTMIAPTGSTSKIAGVNESIEPFFSFEMIRKDGLGTRVIKSPIYEKEMKDNGKKPDYLVTSMEISWEDHIKMQAAFQKYVDASISKTINLPSAATKDDISNAYKMAYNLGCKGITVYRDKSKDVQVLNIVENNKINLEIEKVERDYGVLMGDTYKVATGEGSLFVTINRNGNPLPIELFGRVGKAGNNANAYTEAIGRLISLLLQNRVPLEDISKQLIGIAGDKPIFHKIGKYKKILSVPDAIGKILEDYSNNNNMENLKDSKIGLKKQILIEDDICNICQQEFVHASGCISCGCGSKCD